MFEIFTFVEISLIHSRAFCAWIEFGEYRVIRIYLATDSISPFQRKKFLSVSPFWIEPVSIPMIRIKNYIIVIREFSSNICQIRDNKDGPVHRTGTTFNHVQSDTGTSFLVARILTYCVIPRNLHNYLSRCMHNVSHGNLQTLHQNIGGKTHERYQNRHEKMSLKRYLKYCEHSDRPNIIITFQ